MIPLKIGSEEEGNGQCDEVMLEGEVGLIIKEVVINLLFCNRRDYKYIEKVGYRTVPLLKLIATQYQY